MEALESALHDVLWARAWWALVAIALAVLLYLGAHWLDGRFTGTPLGRLAKKLEQTGAGFLRRSVTLFEWTRRNSTQPRRPGRR